MSFFANIQQITYDGRLVIDITKSYDIIDRFKNQIELFEIYTIQDGERIEQISEKFYGDQDLFWIILMMNDITDPFYDYPITSQELEAKLALKYTPSELGTVRHHVLNGMIYGNVDPSPGISTPVTFREYEIDMNDERRKLKIPKKQYIQQIVREFRKITRL